ncbi:MAG: class I SAM-dependent methyltransferase family protein [Candidatus Heimdallarchaeota archaeon]|nr:class I SAM-dependent methyltransferase family protein [Candidatus Heimdallarchaeota archaeon]
MQIESIGVKILFRDAETLRKTLLSHGVIDASLDFKREKNHLIIPLTLSKDDARQLLLSLSTIEGFELNIYSFTQKDIQPKNLYEAASLHIPENLHEFIPKAYDVIGEIAVVDIVEEVMEYKKEIGEALYSLFPSLKTVYRKASAVSGQLRTRGLELIAGEKQCETIHHEHGVTIFVDACETYFSPRLVYEHKRVADLIKEGEVIIDLFTGVGPFPLHIAQNHNATIYAIDINHKAIKCLEKSLLLNKLKGLIKPLHGNCRELASSLPNADRIIMNLPSYSLEYIDVVCQILKPGGIIHFYQFVATEDGKNLVVSILKQELAKFDWEIKEIIDFHKVRESAPREIHACLEVVITPQST